MFQQRAMLLGSPGSCFDCHRPGDLFRVTIPSNRRATPGKSIVPRWNSLSSFLDNKLIMGSLPSGSCILATFLCAQVLMGGLLFYLMICSSHYLATRVTCFWNQTKAWAGNGWLNLCLLAPESLDFPGFIDTQRITMEEEALAQMTLFEQKQKTQMGRGNYRKVYPVSRLHFPPSLPSLLSPSLPVFPPSFSPSLHSFLLFLPPASLISPFLFILSNKILTACLC